jgi:hypothetical protein
MEYTEQQKAEFRNLFKVRRKNQIVVAVIAIAFMVPLFLAREQPAVPTVMGIPAQAYFIVFGLVIVGSLAFSLKNWRCPACSKYLGKNVSPRFCPGCGVSLQ